MSSEEIMQELVEFTDPILVRQRAMTQACRSLTTSQLKSGLVEKMIKWFKFWSNPSSVTESNGRCIECEEYGGKHHKTCEIGEIIKLLEEPSNGK